MGTVSRSIDRLELLSSTAMLERVQATTTNTTKDKDNNKNSTALQQTIAATISRSASSPTLIEADHERRPQAGPDSPQGPTSTTTTTSSTTASSNPCSVSPRRQATPSVVLEVSSRESPSLSVAAASAASASLESPVAVQRPLARKGYEHGPVTAPRYPHNMATSPDPRGTAAASMSHSPRTAAMNHRHHPGHTAAAAAARGVVYPSAIMRPVGLPLETTTTALPVGATASPFLRIPTVHDPHSPVHPEAVYRGGVPHVVSSVHLASAASAAQPPLLPPPPSIAISMSEDKEDANTTATTGSTAIPPPHHPQLHLRRRFRSYDELLRDNCHLYEQLQDRDRALASLQARLSTLEDEITELRQLPTGKISHIPIKYVSVTFCKYNTCHC